MGRGLGKIQYPKRGFEKFCILARGPEIFCVLQSPKNPKGGGLNIDQPSSYCTSI